jgi:inosine/xanthosine triphosphatase
MKLQGVAAGPMRVVVGSQNPVKIDAARQAFIPYFDSVEVVGVRTQSGVNPVPTSEGETLQGAFTRVRAAAASIPDAQFAVGIEAGIVAFDKYKLALGFAVVKEAERLGVGCSVGFQLPPGLVSQLDPTSDAFKQLIDEQLGGENLFQGEGVIGVLTKGRLTRTTILRDAVVCALAQFISPQFY